MIDIKLLEKINNEMLDENVSHKKRTFLAIEKLATKYEIQIVVPSKEYEELCTWLESRSKPDADQIGSKYRSVYYYDSEFWPIDIEKFSGTLKITPIDSLSNMPASTKNLLENNYNDYLKHWTDCFDYAYGVDDLKSNSSLDPFGLELFKAANEDLCSAVTLLLEPRPNRRAILSLAMATEIFIKSYIALSIGLTEAEAIVIGHDLKKGLDKFIKASESDKWESIREKLNVYPEFVGGRYKEQQEVSTPDLWTGFTNAQSFGVEIIRRFTESKIRLTG